MKRIIVACGSGVATSTMVAERLKNELAKRNFRAEVRVVDFKSLKNHAANADLFVSIAPYEKIDYGIPVVTGIPLLTGAGVDETVNQIIKILSK
ncbi:MAG TPA: PTS sugar transporter subunit IIB [Firmicutes bacterium]|nr:PTS sugar transporter subunit IIB [Candidatus Fermentithermobacillaceae bacterium]